MSTEANKAVDRRLVDEALNKGNLAIAEELIAPECVDHAPPLGREDGPAGFTAAVAGFRASFPDLQATIDEHLAEGNLVARRMTMRGSQQGDLFGRPPTGKTMTITGIHFMRLADGQVAEHWGINDGLALMQQLGAVPGPPGQAGDDGGSAAPGVAADDGGDPEANKDLARRYWQDVSSRGVVAAIDDYFAADVVAHPPASVSPQPIRGREAWKAFSSTNWGALSDLAGTVEDVIAEGNLVALRLTVRGTHSGPMMGLSPTNKPVSFGGMQIFRINDGKIVESWSEFDVLELLQQLGAIPAPG